MTRVRTTGEDCRVTTTSHAGARSRRLDAAEAAPMTSATSRVAARVPRTRARELTTPSWNSCQAGSLSSIGSGQPDPQMVVEPGERRLHLRCEAGGGRLGDQRRQDAGGIAARRRCRRSRARATARAAARGRLVKIALRRASARNSPSRCMIWLISSSAWARRSLFALGTAMPQGTGSKPNFRSKRAANAGSPR